MHWKTTKVVLAFVNFRFADDIVINAEKEDEADDIIVISMETACTRYKMEIGKLRFTSEIFPGLARTSVVGEGV